MRMEVDVVIPLYNNAAYIIEALASVLAQTHLPARVFVVDDGSTDDGPALVEAFIAAHTEGHRVRLARQPNRGPNSARNHGLRLGNSPFVAFLDADDVWHPCKLEQQLQCFTPGTSGGTVLVHCGAYAVDAASRTSPLAASNGAALRGDCFDRLLLRNTVPGGSSAVLIRRSAFGETGPFDEALLTSEDHDMWLRLARVGAFDHAPQDLVGLRQHTGNTSKNALRMLQGLVAFDAKWMKHARTRPDVLRYWGHLIALFAARVPEQELAYSTIRRGLTATDVRALARRALGSMKLYILLKRLRATFRPDRA
ncbi:MAG: glycosyltransferase [Flavobacteriales bacterium]|nr:MAG: glycosyltransferase [Flavobacteriales bacterium]